MEFRWLDLHTGGKHDLLTEEVHGFVYANSFVVAQETFDLHLIVGCLQPW